MTEFVLFVPSMTLKPLSSAAIEPRPAEDPRFTFLRGSLLQDPEIRSLLQERNLLLFEQGLLHWAFRQESHGKTSGAAEAYAALATSGEQVLARQAARRIDLLRGKGGGADRAEEMLGKFLREALHPAGIFGMTVASGTFRLTRLASLNFLLRSTTTPLGRGMGATFAAELAGFAAEVPAMVFASKGLQSALGEKASWDTSTLGRELQAGALFLGGMKLGASAGSAIARRLPKPASVPRMLLEQSGLLGGSLLGKSLEGRFSGPGPHAGPWWLEGVAAYLQGHAGSGLARGLLGAKWRALEAALPSTATPRKGGPAYAPAAHSDSEGPGSESRLPRALWGALTAVHARDSQGLRVAHEALDRLFKYDAAGSSTGSLQNALWQSFLHEALGDPHSQQGRRALVSALTVMAQEPSREALLRLGEEYGYAPRWRLGPGEYAAAEEEIRGLAASSLPDRYSPFEIGSALAIARESPVGKILLGRLRNILAEKDLPGKVRELIVEESFDTARVLRQLRSHGLSREILAHHISGTAHTAYLDDLRVARKVVSVYEDIEPYLQFPALREGNLRKLQRDFMEVWERYPDLGADAVVEFLARQSDRQAQALLEALQPGNPKGALELQVVSPNGFDDYIREQGLPASTHLSLFLKPRDTRLASLLWLRAMPEGHRFDNPEAAFSDFADRIVAAFHEWEHFRHFHGDFDPREATSRPFDIRNMNREDRLASETMAILEQLRWSLRHFDDDFSQVGRQMGENLAQFGRNMADWGYFGKP